MSEVLFVVFVVSLVGFALFLMTIGLTWRHLKHQVRVRPSTPSDAPATWLVDLSEPARLHRRLRKATTTARAAASAGDGTLATLASDLEDQAVAVERQLVVLSKLGRGSVSSEAKKGLIDRITRIEKLSRRLADVAVQYAQRPALPKTTDDPLAQLSEKLDHLAAARQELDALEAMIDLEPPTSPGPERQRPGGYAG